MAQNVLTAAEVPPPPSHWAEYGAEFAGTLLLVFGGLSAVTFDFGHGLPMALWLPSASLRRLVTGLLFAGTGSLIAVSPLGKLSGAHINPAVSMAFWLQGKMHFPDFIGYIISQLAGATAGAWLLQAVWGRYAFSIQDGITLPGAGYSVADAFAAEVIMTFLLVFFILFFVSQPRLMRWTPLMNWLLVATLVWVGAPISGTSLNPARSLGPALLMQLWTSQWIYVVAPLLGSLLALGAFQLVPGDVLTAKLFHVSSYRSIFKHDVVSSRKDGKLA